MAGPYTLENVTADRVIVTKYGVTIKPEQVRVLETKDLDLGILTAISNGWLTSDPVIPSDAKTLAFVASDLDRDALWQYSENPEGGGGGDILYSNQDSVGNDDASQKVLDAGYTFPADWFKTAKKGFRISVQGFCVSNADGKSVTIELNPGFDDADNWNTWPINQAFYWSFEMTIIVIDPIAETYSMLTRGLAVLADGTVVDSRIRHWTSNNYFNFSNPMTVQVTGNGGATPGGITKRSTIIEKIEPSA